MSEQQTVYIVTSGEYSAYHIDRVYSDKAEAEAYVAAHNERDSWGEDSHNIEEWPIGEAAYYTGNVWRGAWTAWKKTPEYKYERSVTGMPGWIDYSDPFVKDAAEEYDGVHPGSARAEVYFFGPTEAPTQIQIEVIGLDRDWVTKALYDRVAHAKARLAGIA